MPGGVFKKGQSVHSPRRDERYQTEGLRCPAGQVLDLSVSGMRLRAERKPKLKRGEVQAFALSTGTHRVSVTGCVAWVRRTSLLSKEYELGIRFVNLTPGLRKVLQNLAQYGIIGKMGTGSFGSSGGRTARRPAQAEEPEREPVNAEIELDDYYEVLGVERNAAVEQIHTAYRKLAAQHHPDAGGDAEAFVQISKAYSVLKDAGSRARYDTMLGQARKSA